MAEDGTTDVSSLRATAHPLRLRMLSLLTGTALSAAEVARELDITHANASYHLRVLRSAGLLVEAGEENVRGGIAKRYRHPWERPDPPSARPEDADHLVRAVADELVRRHALRRRGTGAATTDAEVWLEPAVWERARALVEEASTLVHAEARPPHTPGTLHVNLTASLFQIGDDG